MFTHGDSQTSHSVLQITLIALNLSNFLLSFRVSLSSNCKHLRINENLSNDMANRKISGAELSVLNNSLIFKRSLFLTPANKRNPMSACISVLLVRLVSLSRWQSLDTDSIYLFVFQTMISRTVSLKISKGVSTSRAIPLTPYF